MTCCRYEITIRWVFGEGHSLTVARATISNRNDVEGIYLFPTPPPNGVSAPSGSGLHHHLGFTIILRHTTLDRTPLDEWPVRCRDLYLTTQNTHNRQTSMPPAGFEPAIPASERPHTHASDRAATRNGIHLSIESHSCYEQHWFFRLFDMKCKFYVMWWHRRAIRTANITREGCLSAR
jgi:hypothetical protein